MATQSPRPRTDVTLELSSAPVTDEYLSTDPNAGDEYLSTDPNAGTPQGETEPPQPGDSPLVAARKFWTRINPIAAAYALYQVGGETLRGAGAAAMGDQAGAVQHFNQGLGQIGKAQGQIFERAKERAAAGDYVGAAAQTAAWLIPLLGPMLSEDAELLREGRKWEALGGALGGDLGATLPLPLGGRKLKAGLPAMNPPAQVADAVAWAERQGIQPSASTATGNPAVLAVEHIADRSLGGTFVAQPKFKAHAEGLTRVGGELADRAYPAAVTPERVGRDVQAAAAGRERAVGDAYGRVAGRLADDVLPVPVTAEQAGTGLRQDVAGRVASHHATAGARYDRLREIEAAPESTFEILEPTGGTASAPGTAPARFAPEGAGIADVFQGVLAEAKRTGYRGSAQALHEKFLTKLDEVKGAEDMQQGAILQAIREYGGINAELESAGGMAGEIKHLWEFSTGQVTAKGLTKNTGKLKKSWTRPTGGFKVGGTHYAAVLRKDGGLSLDDMATSLRQDPQWNHIEGPAELLDAIHEAIKPRRANKQAGKNIEGGLRYVGVEPGARWWAAADDMPPDAPLPQMQLPVDKRPAKEALRPLRDRMRRQMPLTQADASVGLKALDNLVDGPDYAPATEVDADLSVLKKIVREAAAPNQRNRSQGLAAKAVAELEKAVRDAVALTGDPEASQMLTEGRSATVAKYKAIEVLDKLREEPVQTFQQATWSNDRGIALLRRLARQAPGRMREVGRALVDEILLPATRGGRFEVGQARAMQKRWHAIGPETRKIVIPDAGLVRQFDRFFDELVKLEDRGAAPALTDEPVGVYRHLVAPKNAHLELLQSVAKLSPSTLPKIGRAFLDELLATATAEGGFTRQDGIFLTWSNLGTETKRLLFKHPGLVQDLDRFFLYAKKSAATPNPSGTAHVTAMGAGLYYVYMNPITGAKMQIGGAVLSKMLHSPAGVRALTRGLSIPISNKLAATAVAAELMHLSGADQDEDDK